VRVPALLISPWVDQTYVKTTFDHTSLLAYLIDKWNLGPLTARVSQANSIKPLIRTTGAPREDTPPNIPGAPAAVLAAAEAAPAEPPSENQKSLIAFTEHLESQITEPVNKQARAVASLAGWQMRAAAAKDRLGLFLDQQKAKVGTP